MKLTKFTSLLAVALMLGAGCAHKTPPVTDLGKSGGGKTGSGPGEGLTASDSGVASTNDVTPTGIPAGQGHPGWIKDSETLKADSVHFDYDSSVVKASEKSKVASVADYLKANSANAVAAGTAVIATDGSAVAKGAVLRGYGCLPQAQPSLNVT